MAIVQPRMKRFAMIWLSITFRALLWGVGAALAASVVIGIGVASVGGGEDLVRQIAGIASPVIGAPVSLFAAYAQLGRKCGDVRLVLMAAE